MADTDGDSGGSDPRLAEAAGGALGARVLTRNISPAPSQSEPVMMGLCK